MVAGLKGLAFGKGVGGVQGIVAEKSIDTSVDQVCACFGDDIDGRAARATQFRGIVAAVDLKLLDCFLAQGQADTTRIVVGFAAIDRDAVAAAVATVKR